jgi:hypothetical protein
MKWPCLCVELGKFRYPLEIKLDYGAKTIPEGVAQLSDYMERLGCAEGWLVVFDRDPAKSWDEKIFRRGAITASGKAISLFGC